MPTTVFYRAAKSSVARYVREIALLPSFPPSTPLAETVHDDGSVEIHGVQGPVVLVLATCHISGQVLPRTEDAWLAVRPFQDISKSTLAAWATALVGRRMTALLLLVRLSVSQQFGWDAMMECGGQRPREEILCPRRSFWLELLRDLSPDASSDRSMGLERCLVALSRSPSPRFLLCVDSDPSQIDFADLLDQFLWADKTDVVTSNGEGGVNAWGKVMETCALPPGSVVPHRIVELGLSFTTGKITHAMVTKLFDVLHRLHSSKRRADGIIFRVTALRFGVGCTVQPKAMETIGERWSPEFGLTTFSLGSIDGVKPAAVQGCLLGLTSAPLSKLRRLGVAASDSFPAFASLFREASHSTVEEVDVRYDPTEHNAAWLAFAFFHADSKSSVSSLCLRTTQGQSVFDEEWINAFERALQSHMPSEDLVGEPAEEEGEEAGHRVLVTIHSTTPVKSHPYSGAKLLCKLGCDQEVEKVVQVKNYVGVILPGLSVGWVPTASIVASRSEPSTLTSGIIQTNGRVTSLAIDRIGVAEYLEVTEQHITSMLRLLSLVGKPLESLQLPDCRFGNNHFAQILRFCPKLRELNISGHCVTRMAPLVEAYATGLCQIDTLSLSHPFLMTNDSDIAEQLTAMLNQRDSNDLPLRRLSMHLISQSAMNIVLNTSTTQIATNLALALSANRQLEFVQLTTITPLVVGSRLGLDPLPLDFSASPVSLSLASERKLAFLSVVHPKHEGHKQRQSSASNVWGRLDAHTLSLIFSFAREAVARHVLRCH
jgi:hypothetical protein